MAKIISLETVQRIIDAQAERAEGHANEPGESGAISRFVLSVNGPLTIWRCSEENRETEPYAIAGALISCFATTLAAHIQTHVPAEKRDLAIAASCIELEAKLHACLMQANSGDTKYVSTVEREEIGAA